VVRSAEAQNLTIIKVQPMPANNFSLVFAHQ